MLQYVESPFTMEKATSPSKRRRGYIPFVNISTVEWKFKRTEMRMIRWMCGASLNNRHGDDRIASEDLRERLGLECIGVVLRRGRLRWFGHVERMEDSNWVKRVRNVNVEGAVTRGRPKKTWDEVIQRDLRYMNLNRETARDRAVWRAAIR